MLSAQLFCDLRTSISSLVALSIGIAVSNCDVLRPPTRSGAASPPGIARAGKGATGLIRAHLGLPPNFQGSSPEDEAPAVTTMVGAASDRAADAVGWPERCIRGVLGRAAR